MELYDYYFQVIMNEVNNLRTEELMSIHWSLVRAVQDRQYKEIQDNRGNFCGFVTWEIKPSNQLGRIDIGITNLVIVKQARGTYNLMKIINYLRRMYPNVAAFVWENRKHKEPIEFKQRGKAYVEDSKTFIQSTR